MIDSGPWQPDQARDFLITLERHRRIRKTVWESKQPFPIDYPVRWLLEKDTSGIYLCQVEWKGVPPAPHLLKRTQIPNETLFQGSRITLTDQAANGGEPLSFCVKALRLPPPLYSRHPEALRDEAPLGHVSGSLSLFCGVNRHLLTYRRVGTTFKIHIEREALFSYTQNYPNHFITPFVDGLTLEMERAPARQFPRNQPSSLGDLEWRFGTFRWQNHWWRLSPIPVVGETNLKRQTSGVILSKSLFGHAALSRSRADFRAWVCQTDADVLPVLQGGPVKPGTKSGREMVTPHVRTGSKVGRAFGVGLAFSVSFVLFLIPEETVPKRWHSPSQKEQKEPSPSPSPINTRVLTLTPEQGIGPQDFVGPRRSILATNNDSDDSVIESEGEPFEVPQNLVPQSPTESETVPENSHLPNEGVLRTLKRHLGSFEDCYQKTVGRDGKSGHLILEWKIEGDGSVLKVSENRSEFKDPMLSQCLCEELKQIRFPRPRGGDNWVRFPIAFSGEGRASIGFESSH